MDSVEGLFTQTFVDVESQERYIVVGKSKRPPNDPHHVIIEWHGFLQAMRDVQAVVNEGTYRLVRIETVSDNPSVLRQRFVFQREG